MLNQVLNQLGMAALVVSQDFDVMFLSAAAKNILDQADGLFIADNRLQTSVTLEGTQLKKLMDDTIRADAQNGGDNTHGINLEMQVSRPSRKQPLHLRIMPLHASNPESVEARHVIIMIRDLEANCTGLLKRLKDNFHLTPRECECAVMLAEGLPLGKIAKQLDISEQTIRLHLKHMFIKMNVSKQHELVAKLLHLQRKR
jgi:DNA-binding CsgD family transcriptional regulator